MTAIRLVVYCALILSLCGCEPRKAAERLKKVVPEDGKMSEMLRQMFPDEPKITTVEDIALAETVMMAKPYVFKYERDPFKPLIEKKSKPGKYAPVNFQERMDYFLIGTMFQNGVGYALIETAGKKKLYKEGEVVGDLIVKTIETQGAVFKKGNEELSIKVGGQLKK